MFYFNRENNREYIVSENEELQHFWYCRLEASICRSEFLLLEMTGFTDQDDWKSYAVIEGDLIAYTHSRPLVSKYSPRKFDALPDADYLGIGQCARMYKPSADEINAFLITLESQLGTDF